MTGEENRSLKVTALLVEDLAALLSKSGAHVTAEMLRRDIDEGAPVNADGTVNLVHYAAWLVRQATGDRLQTTGEGRT